MTERSNPKVLVLSGTIPGEPGVGGVILGDLQKALPARALEFIPAVTQQIVDLGWLDRAERLAGHVSRRFEPGFRPVRGIVGEIVGAAARKIKFERHCKELVAEICKNEAAKSCNKIWAVLDCQTVIHIATAVAQRLQKPLVVMVWDAPELLVRQYNLDRWSAANLLESFQRTVRESESVGVICEQMQKTYTEKFGSSQYVILRHGIREDLWAKSTESASDRLIIGFAGSITAQQPFNRLINALDEANWNIQGRNVTLRLIGSRYTLDSRQPQRIEYFGWRSLDETVQLLAECDLEYLPQPFEEHLRPLAELSFPTKLTTYLAAGKRVLLHAPTYASVNSFFQKYPVGNICSSLETPQIISAVENLIRRSKLEVDSAIDAARKTEFNNLVFVNRFQKLIGFDWQSRESSTAPEAVEQA